MNREGDVTPLQQLGLLSADNHLFRLARSGRLRLPQSWLSRWPRLMEKVFYPGLVLVFAFLVPIISGLIGVPLLIIPYFIPEIGDEVLGQFLFLAGAFLPFFFLIWGWLRLFERRSLWSTGMQRPFLLKYLRGFLIGLGMFTAVVGLMGLSGSLAVERPVSEPIGPLVLAGGLFIFLGWMIQGAAEEVLARGFLLPIMGVRWGTVASLVVSSLFFAALHLSNPHVTAISLLNLVLFGLFAALYALYEGGLWGVFAIHAVWNWAQGNVFGFSVSGLEINGGILLDLMENGPDWLTGGLFGPEGGLIVTFVLVVSSLLIWWAGRRRASSSVT